MRAKCGEKRLVGVHVNQDYMKGLLCNLANLEREVQANMRKQELMVLINAQGNSLLLYQYFLILIIIM